ncbi:guanine nucleotide exchange factor [Morchella snyderi]|nr:guanine nucleotide exchange factor [Morchella snyderi]
MASLPASAQPKPGEPKQASVERLLAVLSKDLTDPTLTPAQRTATLEHLKVHGRDPNGSDAIFTRVGIDTLGKYAFDQPSSDISTSREALRCLANALLLNQDCRQTFADLGYALKAAERFKTASIEDEFLLSRILFLVTFTPPIPPELLDTTLPTSLTVALDRHTRTAHTQMQEMALTETLKLLFNLGHHTSSPKLLITLPMLLNLLTTIKLPTPPLQGIIIHLINVPLSLPLTPTPELFPRDDESKVVDRLIAILDAATHDPDLDDDAIPLVTLLRKLLELTPPPVTAHMQKVLLPAPEERDAPLGTSNTLPSRLLRLSAAASAPGLRDHVASLLFELSGSSPERYVENVGYGYAVGLLVSRGLDGGMGSGSAGSEVGNERKVNPVTGQWVEKEPVMADPFEGMTMEEKEREAEKMFVLFERLKKTGVIDVKNPVQQAVEEGRFEELED